MPIAPGKVEPSSSSPAALQSSLRSSLGIVSYCLDIAKRARGVVAGVPDLADPLTFVQECWRMGAAGVQFGFGVLDGDAVRGIREFKERTGMQLEGTVDCRLSETDPARFEGELRTLQELGVTVARTVIFSGRRYEIFKSLQEVRAAGKEGRRVLAKAEGMAKRFRVRLALENHKDERLEERLELLNAFSSEWIGACLDVGNNLALLEDPVTTARAFAPWTLTVHFKDQGVRAYEDGFLLADVPLGRGCIDLQEVVAIVQAARRQARFNLELITRDALRVPMLRPEYWASYGDATAKALAEHLAFVHRRSAHEPFAQVTRLPLAERVALERANVQESLRYAVEKLGFNL